MLDFILFYLVGIIFHPIGYVFLKLITLGKFKLIGKYDWIPTVVGFLVIVLIILFISIN